MSVTDKMLDAAQGAYDTFSMTGVCDRNATRKAIEAAMQAAPAVEQEPVNLRGQADMIWRNDDAIVHVSEFKRWLSVLAPLYTRPQPKREPLPVPYILDMFLLNTDDFPLDKTTHYRFSQDMLISIVRDVEKAHGIGV
jgi:hypothetical protein